MVEVISFIICTIMILFTIFFSGYINERKAFERYKKKLIDNYGKECCKTYKDGALEHIAQYSKIHQTQFSIDDITWNDLDMDRVFMQLNYANSSAGEEYLYYMLKNPEIKEKDWSDFEEIVTYFMENESDRQKMQVAFGKMGYTGKYSVYEYINTLDELGKSSIIKEMIPNIFIILSIGLCFFHLGYGLLCVFGGLIFNLITYFKKKSEIDPYITCFSYIFRLLKQIERLDKLSLQVITKDIEELKGIKKKFYKFAKNSYLLMSPKRMSGDMMEIGIDYIRMFFHLDIIKFYSMLEEVRKYTEDIDRMISVIGKMDAYIAIGEYRTFLTDYCIPEYKINKYEAENIYHPLLKEPVKNDVNVTKSMLITGSNASGKSTFLKTVALNAILAQSIHTACADVFVSDYYKVFSSISLKDNIFDGDSYYMAEIKSIKRMLVTNEEKIPVLAFVDEVLRGTNTIERIAASSVILKKMAMNPGYCFAATHDVELTHILEAFFENVHFEETITDGDICFNYKLLKGRATTRNAIKLLELMDYDKELINQAKAAAENFEQTKAWRALS